MIARIWKGAVRREDGDAYASYIRDTGFNEYGATGGNCGPLCFVATMPNAQT